MRSTLDLCSLDPASQGGAEIGTTLAGRLQGSAKNGPMHGDQKYLVRHGGGARTSDGPTKNTWLFLVRPGAHELRSGLTTGV